MNVLTANLTERVANNDPTLGQVSVRPFPLLDITPEEIESILRALRKNTFVERLDLSIPDYPSLESSGNYDFSAIIDNVKFSSSGAASDHSSYDFLRETFQSNSTLRHLSAAAVSNSDAWIALCQGLQFNTSIEEVTFGDNVTLGTCIELNLDVCIAIAEFLANTTKLRKLTLRGFTISSCEATKALAVGLSKNKSLRTLELSQIEAENFGVLLEAISGVDSSIKRLSIVDCDLDFEELGDVDGAHPFETLAKNANNLSSLRITDCILGTSEVPSLCEGMKYNASIELLDLSGNDLIASCCEPISEMLSFNTALQRLVLEDNIIGDSGLLQLCKGLVHNNTLLKLDIRANYISSEGCNGLIDALGPHSGIQTLLLSENEIGDKGASSIGAMLQRNQNLDILELDACLIGEKGIADLCFGLTINKSLRELNLSNNVLTEKGAASISTMLATNAVLQSLYLSSCHISDAVLGVLVTSMKNGENEGLRELWLSFNTFGNEGVKYLADAIRCGCRLQALGIQFNSFDKDGIGYIVSALQKNVYLHDLYLWNGMPSTETGNNLLDKMDHWLGLNRAGRRAITECKTKSIWPQILSLADQAYGPNAVFHCLLERPDLGSDL